MLGSKRYYFVITKPSQNTRTPKANIQFQMVLGFHLGTILEQTKVLHHFVPRGKSVPSLQENHGFHDI